MRIFSVYTVALVLLALASCGAPPAGFDGPTVSPLGADLQSYRAPRDPTAGPTAAPQKLSSSDAIGGTLTLRRALALALLHNPELAAFSWEVRAREAGALQAGLPPNPELAVDLENFAGSGAREGFDEAETTVRLGQLVELGGKRAKRRRLARLEQTVAEWSYEIKRIDVLTQVTRAFVDVLAAQERLRRMSAWVRTTDEAWDLVQAQVKSGAVSPVEATRARVTLASSQLEQKSREIELRAAIRRLAATFGSDGTDFTGAQGDLERIGPPVPLESLLALIHESPHVARWDAQLETRRAAVALEDSRRVPDVFVDGGVRHLSDEDDNALVLTLSVPLPLSDRNQGAALEARHLLNKAAAEKRAALMEVRTSLLAEYQNLASARDQLVTLHDRILPDAEKALDASEKAFRKGQFHYLDVLDAQRTLFDLEQHHLDAHVAYHRAAAEIERLVATPLEEVARMEPARRAPPSSNGD